MIIHVPFTAIYVTIAAEKVAQQPINEDATMVDVLTKMLMDKGCTVNKEAMEYLGSFFMSSGRAALDEGVTALEKAKQQLEWEEERWSKKR